MNLDLLQEGRDYLFRIVPKCAGHEPVYVLAAEGAVTAYGPCPVSARETLGRDGAELDYRECVKRVAMAAAVVWEIDRGGTECLKFEAAISPEEFVDPPLPSAAFMCRETAALASAAAGWPPPVDLLPPAA